MSKKIGWLLFIYFLLLIIFAIFSYSLTAPNLILSSNEVFWKFQTYMWQTFFNNRQLLSYTYAAIITALWIVYIIILKVAETKSHISYSVSKKAFAILLIVITPLLFSNNALSYDVFNYIFNAKMVVVYHANPHVKVALDYAFDDWTRFMHNTHTPAPYGYGWTAFSLIPYILGVGKFLPTWIIFRLFSLLSIGLLFLTYQLFNHQKSYSLTLKSYLLVFLNPLLLIEVLSNSHNDLWMMTPALISLILVEKLNKQRLWPTILISLLLLIFSISTKFATALLIPIWFILITKKIFSLNSYFLNLINHWPLLASILMFLPLLLSRSQQFHPWYLTWSFVWIPLFLPHKFSSLWRQLLIVLSASSLYRYLPYLWFGEYSAHVLWQQKLITWSPLLFLVLWRLKGTIIK